MRISSKCRRRLLPALLAAAAALSFAVLPLAGRAQPQAAPPAAPQSEDNARLAELASAEAARHLPPLTAHEHLVAGPINAGVKLARCNAPVKSTTGLGGHMRDRILIELRCQGTPSWHLYVPVRIVGTTQVMIAAHAIVGGTVLAANDIRAEQRDLTQLPPGYMDDPAATVGLTAGRPIPSGAVLTNQLLLGSKAVQRGQTVTLLADGGGVSISMEGRALADAMVNQRVKVENLSSGKVVEGIARSQQVVEIILQ